MIIDEDIEFELMSPQKQLVSKSVAFVVVPGSEGDFAVLPRRAPIVANLRPGVISVYEMENGKEKVVSRTFVPGGLVDVNNNHCRVFAEEAVLVKDIDRGAISNNLQKFKKALNDSKSIIQQEEINAQIAYHEMIIATVEQDERLKKAGRI